MTTEWSCCWTFHSRHRLRTRDRPSPTSTKCAKAWKSSLRTYSFKSKTNSGTKAKTSPLRKKKCPSPQSKRLTSTRTSNKRSILRTRRGTPKHPGVIRTPTRGTATESSRSRSNLSQELAVLNGPKSQSKKRQSPTASSPLQMRASRRKTTLKPAKPT